MSMPSAWYEYSTENQIASGMDGNTSSAASTCHVRSPPTKRDVNCPIMIDQANHQKR